MKLMAHDLTEAYWRKVAKRHGIRYQTYWRRLTLGWTPQQAATTPLVHKGARTPNPDSTLQKLQRHGLGKATVWRYRKRNSDTTLTDDEIIGLALAKRDRVNLAKLAREHGLDRSTVSRRIHKLGWSLQDALNTPKKTPQDARAMRTTKGWIQ